MLIRLIGSRFFSSQPDHSCSREKEEPDSAGRDIFSWRFFR